MSSLLFMMSCLAKGHRLAVSVQERWLKLQVITNYKLVQEENHTRITMSFVFLFTSYSTLLAFFFCISFNIFIVVDFFCSNNGLNEILLLAGGISLSTMQKGYWTCCRFVIKLIIVHWVWRKLKCKPDSKRYYLVLG